MLNDDNLKTIDTYQDEMKEQLRVDRLKTIPQVYKYKYDLLQEVNNGVKYFGQRKVINGTTTALCICPHCNELWRVSLGNIKSGSTTNCGCVKNKGNKHGN